MVLTLFLPLISFFPIFFSFLSSTISFTLSAGFIPNINIERIAITPKEIIIVLAFPTKPIMYSVIVLPIIPVSPFKVVIIIDIASTKIKY